MTGEWVQVVSSVGFPIAAAAALFWLLHGTVKELTAAIAKNTEAISMLICKISDNYN